MKIVCIEVGLRCRVCQITNMSPNLCKFRHLQYVKYQTCSISLHYPTSENILKDLPAILRGHLEPVKYGLRCDKSL